MLQNIMPTLERAGNWFNKILDLANIIAAMPVLILVIIFIAFIYNTFIK